MNVDAICPDDGKLCAPYCDRGCDDLGLVYDEPDLIAWAGKVLLCVTIVPVIVAATIGLWVWLS